MNEDAKHYYCDEGTDEDPTPVHRCNQNATTNHPAPVILDDAALEEIEARITKLPEGPWFAAFDRAKECGPHRDSGLALVDTGRESDWPIARLCEWHAAKFIAASITDIPALCQTVRALRAENELAEKVFKFILPNRPLATISELAKPALDTVDALREQLGQQRHAIDAATKQIVETSEQLATMQRERNEALDQCTELHQRLAQVEKERREARVAAFRDAIQIAKEEAFERRMAYCVLERLEAAANSVKDSEGEGGDTHERPYR